MKTHRTVPFQGFVQLFIRSYPDEEYAISYSERLFRELQEYLDDSRSWHKIARVTQEQEAICSECKRKWERDPTEGPPVCAWCGAPEKEK